MKNKGTRFTFISYLLAFFSLFSIVFGSFLTGGDISTSTIRINSGKGAVCYIGSTKYTSIEKALQVAGDNSTSDTIYVIPGTNPTITSDCVLADGDTLCIPYNDSFDNNTHEYFDESRKNDSAGVGYGDNNPDYNKNKVTISNNKTLSVNGTLILGGMTGSTAMQSGTVYFHCTIQMGTGSKIKFGEHGKFECYGFVKEDTDNGAELSFAANSTLVVPISFYDYASAGTMLDIKNNDVFPFKQFDVASIRPKMVFSSGSKMQGRIHIYGDSVGNINTTANLVGTSGSFINMDTNSTLTWKFSDSSSLASTTNKMNTHTTKLSLSGNASLGSLEVKIKYIITYNVNSAEFYLPIPCGYNIILEENSFFTMPDTIKGVKFMPGSKVTCKKNSTVDINCGALFYQNCSATDGTNFSYPSSTPATIENAGTININSGFDGIIQVGDVDNATLAKVVVGTNYKRITDSKEGTSSSIYTWGGLKGQLVRKKFDPSTEDQYLYVNYEQREFSNGKTYISRQINQSTNFGWANDSIVTHGIKYVSNSSTSNEVTTASSSFDVDAGNTVITRSSFTNTNSEMTLEGLYYTNDFLTSPKPLGKDANNNYVVTASDAVTYLNGKNYINLYANWVKISQNVNIILRTYNSSGTLEDNKIQQTVAGNEFDISTLTSGVDTTRAESFVKTDDGKKIITKTTYPFNNFKVIDENGNTIISNTSTTTTFIPEVGHTYYIDPVYSENKYYAIYFTNGTHKVVGIPVDIIATFTIDGENKLKASNPIYALDTQTIIIKTEGPRGWTAKYTITIGDKILSGSSTRGKSAQIEFKLNDYSSYLENLILPITIEGSDS